MREAVVKISSDGSKVELDGKGFVGKECTDFFAPLIRVLGEVEKSKKKPEYYHSQKQEIRNG